MPHGLKRPELKHLSSNQKQNKKMETNQMQTIQTLEKSIEAFEQRKSALEVMVETAKVLKIENVEDKAQLAVVSSKRKELKAARVAVQKEGKAMRDLVAPITKMILEKEAQLVGIISPEETRLQAEEDKVEAHFEAIRLEKERIENERVEGLVMQLREFGLNLDRVAVGAMTDEQFSETLSAAKARREMEIKAKADAEEAERIRVELQAKQEQELKAERERLAAEREAIEAEAKAMREELERERAKLRAEKEAAEKAEREAKEAAEMEERAKAEAIRLEEEKSMQERAKIAQMEIEREEAKKTALQKAAPELLAACEGALMEWNETGQLGAEVCKKMQAAIVKAKCI